MKIHSNSPTRQVAGAEQQQMRRKGGNNAAKGAADSVTLSPRASFVQSVRHEAETPQAIRSDVVAEMRASLAAGTLDADIDMDSVLDSLMADL